MDNIIITIGRQYGSGGRMIGQKLAKDLRSEERRGGKECRL